MGKQYTAEDHEAHLKAQDEKRLQEIAAKEKRANEASIRSLVESGVSREDAEAAVKRASLDAKTQALADHEARARAIQRSVSSL